MVSQIRNTEKEKFQFEKSKNQLDLLLTNVPAMVWEARINDKQGEEITYMNKYAEVLLGYSLREWFVNPNFYLSIVYKNDQKRVASEWRQAFERGNGILTFRMVTKSKTILWVETHIFVIRDTKGNKIGMRGVTMNINERMKEEKRKDDFISIASHELKTPVTSIKVYTQLLQKRFETSKDTESAKLLARMDIQLNKLTDLVRELLDVTKIQQGKLALKKEKFLVRDLAKEIIEDLRHITHHRFIVNWQTRHIVYADKDRIHQVLINLITNAIKYSPNADKIVIESKKRKKFIVISVQDFGIGIPQEQQAKIFKRFYQANHGDSTTFPGLGLGLFISSQIVRAHGGEIWVKSSPGNGSTFFFSLPFQEIAEDLPDWRVPETLPLD